MKKRTITLSALLALSLLPTFADPAAQSAVESTGDTSATGDQNQHTTGAGSCFNEELTTTPEDGGRLVATDGKRLACCPATVPPQDFVLPVAACHILGHPDFTADMANITWIDHKEPEKRHVAQKREDRFAPRQKTQEKSR